MKTICSLFVLALGVSAESSDVLHALTMAQRDYAVTRAQAAEAALQLERLQARLQRNGDAMQATVKAAEQYCIAQGKKLDVDAATCKDELKK